MQVLRPLPRGIRLGHPAALLALWFGVGLVRPAPGTWGSACALPLAALLVWAGGPWALAVGIALVGGLGVWAAEVVERRSGESDADAVVVDEVVGQWIALLPAGLDPKLYALGFLAFRVIDIVKPWPASLADRRVKGGLGVMLDDVVAGLYAAAIVLLAGVWLTP